MVRAGYRAFVRYPGIREHFGATQWYTELFPKGAPLLFPNSPRAHGFSSQWVENLCLKFTYLEYQEYHISSEPASWRVDGSEILPQLTSGYHPIIYRVSKPSSWSWSPGFLNHPLRRVSDGIIRGFFSRVFSWSRPTFSGWWLLEPWNFEWLSRNSWEWNNHPNWLHHFSEGWRAQPPTSFRNLWESVFDSLQASAGFPAKRLGEMPIYLRDKFDHDPKKTCMIVKDRNFTSKHLDLTKQKWIWAAKTWI